MFDFILIPHDLDITITKMSTDFVSKLFENHFESLFKQLEHGSLRMRFVPGKPRTEPLPPTHQQSSYGAWGTTVELSPSDQSRESSDQQSDGGRT